MNKKIPLTDSNRGRSTNWATTIAQVSKLTSCFTGLDSTEQVGKYVDNFNIGKSTYAKLVKPEVRHTVDAFLYKVNNLC